MRSKRIFELWRAAWGDESHRLRTVLSTWAHDPSVTEEITTYLDAGASASFVGVTGYLGVDETIDGSWSSLNLHDVFEKLNTTLPHIRQQISDHAAVAGGVPLITYEAGPGLVEGGVIEGGGATGAVTELLISAARDNRMADFYERALNALWVTRCAALSPAACASTPTPKLKTPCTPAPLQPAPPHPAPCNLKTKPKNVFVVAVAAAAVTFTNSLLLMQSS